MITPQHTPLSGSSSFILDESSDPGSVSNTELFPTQNDGLPTCTENSHQANASRREKTHEVDPAEIALALRQLAEKVDQSNCEKERADTLQKENMGLRAELEQARRDLTLAKAELNSTKKLLDERSNSLAIERSLRVHLETVLSKSKSPPAPDLIIGSSIIRDLNADLYVNTEILAESGARPDDIRKLLEGKAHQGAQYGRVVVVAGGNELNYKEEDDANIKETVENMEKCLTAAKAISSKVAVCELPPRAQTDCATERICQLNEELCCLAEKCECDYIKTSQKFYLNDNTANDGYLESDMVHLNLRGSSKLVECLNIKMKDPNSKQKATKKAAYNSKPKSYSQAIKAKVAQNAIQSAAPQNKLFGKGPQKPQRKRQEPNKPQLNINPQQVKTFPPAQNDGTKAKVKPLQAEYGFCGYCGEPGHTYSICRHGQPVTCHECGTSSHKKKFCSYYPKYVQ